MINLTDRVAIFRADDTIVVRDTDTGTDITFPADQAIRAATILHELVLERPQLPADAPLHPEDAEAG